MGVDIITSATSVISATSNVGLVVGQAEPAENYAFLPIAGKWVLIFCIFAGRLEIYTVHILFFPAYWRK